MGRLWSRICRSSSSVPLLPALHAYAVRPPEDGILQRPLELPPPGRGSERHPRPAVEPNQPPSARHPEYGYRISAPSRVPIPPGALDRRRSPPPHPPDRRKRPLWWPRLPSPEFPASPAVGPRLRDRRYPL